jgi:hypothetical protein
MMCKTNQNLNFIPFTKKKINKYLPVFNFFKNNKTNIFLLKNFNRIIIKKF